MAVTSSRIQRIAFVVAVFLSGVAFGKYVTPLLFRIQAVWSLYGTAPEGCQGTSGSGIVWLNSFGSSGDGVYKIDCGDRARVADTFELQRNCE